MKQVISPSSLTITRPEQARFLLDLSQRRYLEPFVGRELTVTQAAAEIGVRPNTLLYAVRRMQKAGLLQVVQTIQRKGRAVKLYGPTAEVFFLPHSALSRGGLEEAIALVDLEGERLLRQNIVLARSDHYPTWGFRMFRHSNGQVYLNTAPDARRDLDLLGLESPAAFSVWFSPLNLGFSDAKALQRELFALLQKYQAKQGAQRYILRLGLAPLLREYVSP